MSVEPRRLRIAVLNRVFTPTAGGAERYSMALVEQLAQAHEIHVFAQMIEHHWPGVIYHRVSAPLRRPRWINQLWYATASWWATRRGFDIVHSHENTWHGQVQTVHVLPLKYNLFQGRSGWSLALRYLKVATSPRLLAYLALERLRFEPGRNKVMVLTSPTLQDLVRQVYPHCRMSVLPPGVDMPSLASDALSARKRLTLPLTGRLLAFVGNDYQKKGLPTLLQALCQLPPDVNLAVVGNPAPIKRFSRLAMSLSLGSRVHFLGHLKDVSPLYEAADLLVHPTLEDTFAMVVLEAMAHGLPVVVSDARYCGIAGLLSNGRNAMILTAPTDAGELAQTIARVLSDPVLHRQLAHAAHEFAELHTWPGVAREQAAIYRQLCVP
jgi:UDP-glucose:(heptosyl)LPS alpha-1,3-glucosyltransferase